MASKKPPKQITIVGHPVRISVEPIDGALGMSGQNKGDVFILIDPSQHGSMLADTMQHEVLHMAYLFGLVSEDDKEERTVTALSTFHAGVLASNPDYREWWFGLFG